MFDTFIGFCEKCKASPKYTVLDANAQGTLECVACGNAIIASDTCINTIKDLIILDTYPQGPLPDGMVNDGSHESTEWLDSHLTLFALFKSDFMRVLQNLNWDYHWFMAEWTYDMSERIYETAKGFNMLMIEKQVETPRCPR